MTDSATLEYFISQRNDLLVIALMGSLNRQGERVLEECRERVASASPRKVVLHLQGLEDRIELGSVPAFARFAKALRETPAELRLSSVHPRLVALLNSKGLLRPAEVSKTLEEAIRFGGNSGRE